MRRRLVGSERCIGDRPWGGTAHPVWFKNDPRVANVKAMGGVFDRAVMQGVAQMTAQIETDIKPLPPDAQQKALS